MAYVEKVRSMAEKKQFPVTGLNRMSIPELKQLANSIKKYKPTSVDGAREEARDAPF